MFNHQKKGGLGAGKKDQAKDYSVTIITSGCHFAGKLYCKGSTRIGGKVEGEIISEGLLIIEEEAMISAEIRAEDIVIQGHLRGTLEAHGKVELSPSCVFEGNIITSSLIVHEGAQFNGRTTMDPNRNMERQSSVDQGKGIGKSYVAGAVGSEGLNCVDLPMTGPEISAHL